MIKKNSMNPPLIGQSITRLDKGEFSRDPIISAYPYPGEPDNWMVFTSKGIWKVENKFKKKAKRK